MFVLVLPIQSSSASLTYCLPYQSISNKKNNKSVMAFKIVVLCPSFGERALVHLNKLWRIPSHHILMMAKTADHFFNDVKT